MSLCQTNQSSCGACCGLFNLDYPHQKLRTILEDRTDFFAMNVDYKEKETVISFREEFEIKESFFPKKDPTIYNCPFLGYIDLQKKRIGCMIHPIKTGDPKSQNFSFYGASICQSYDCKNKERKYSKDWEKIFDSLNMNAFQYSNLAGDHILITRIEDFFRDRGFLLENMFKDYQGMIKKILLRKLEISISNITSFEIDMESSIEISRFIKLIDKLSLAPTDELYIQLQNLHP